MPSPFHLVCHYIPATAKTARQAQAVALSFEIGDFCARLFAVCPSVLLFFARRIVTRLPTEVLA